MAQQTKSTRSISSKEITRSWHLIDLQGKTLGREIPRIAELLQGKHKVSYVPYLDNGDFVVVINAKEVVVTGKKASQKEYTYYSGFPGGQKVVPYKEMMTKKPKEIIRHAVTGMLPKTKLRDTRLSRLFIFEGAEHPHVEKFSNS
ncbi:MAG TPA: 50S ribosomal protein L13 [Candidatus Woesebacteria bacterium]|nr:50S ribosomal protein L13 [Candidatus Woesebacteria bacterium]